MERQCYCKLCRIYSKQYYNVLDEEIYAKKAKKWYSLLARAILSSMLGQFVDNALFMYVGLGMWDWVSIGLRQLTEVGMEVVFFPITLLLVRKINKLSETSTLVTDHKISTE